MIVIDGSYHEGGGQIVRTAVALSALMEKDIRIENIRAKRSNPGLSFQHVSAINAVADLCSAKTKDIFTGSKTIEFSPGRHWKAKNIKVNIPTAGSVGLVLQTIIIAASKIDKKIDIEIEGGATFGKWAPPLTYIQTTFTKAISKLGYNININILRHGFYPKGGSLVCLQIQPPKPQKAIFSSFREKENILGLSIASSNLENKAVASRQTESAKNILQNSNLFGSISIESTYKDSFSTGTGITLWTNNDMFLGTSSIGDIGKKAESVGKEAALEMIEEYKTKACVDKHLCDQLIPFLAIRGGTIQTSQITKHTETNIWVVKKFIDVDFIINKKNKTISTGN